MKVIRAVSGASLSNILHTYETTGASCSGTNGATNRTLTITNTKLTRMMWVYKSGLLIPSSNYTETDAVSSSTVQFSIAVWDNEDIIVVYVA